MELRQCGTTLAPTCFFLHNRLVIPFASDSGYSSIAEISCVNSCQATATVGKRFRRMCIEICRYLKTSRASTTTGKDDQYSKCGCRKGQSRKQKGIWRN